MDAPPVWPPGVRQIVVEDIGRLGINRYDQLFWDGRRIEVRQTLTLSRLQKTCAALAVASAIAGGLGGFITGLNNASLYLCARGHAWLTCPATPR